METDQDLIKDQQYQSDDSILCDECDKMYQGDCPEHGPLDWIKTTRAIDSTHYTPCIASLPDGLLLKESGIPGNEMGVFAARLIYKRTMFGPFEGKKIVQTDQHNRKDLTFCWDLLKDGIPDCILDGTDEKHSNWMRFVTYARDKREQNLIAFQFKGQIFYRTFRDVYPGEELMIWYEDEYTCNLDELHAECSKDQMPEFVCERCGLVFAGSTYLFKHHTFRCPDGPLLRTYGARTTGLVGALFRLPVAIANDSWSSPVTNNNDSTPRPDTDAHHGRRKGKPRKLPRPSEIEEVWNPEQPFGPPPVADLNDNEADEVETTMVMLPPETQALNTNSEDVVEIENNNSNYLKRLTSDEIPAPQLEKKPKLDNEVAVDVENKYPYHCGACGKSFARPTWWAKHESGCCKAKNKAVVTSRNRNQDTETVISGSEVLQTPPKKSRKEPYSCHYCGKSFACPSWRERHEKVHTKYLNKSNEETSVKPVDASVTESLPHVCTDCGKGFSFPSRLARHRAAKHSAGKAPQSKIISSSRKHICRDCGRGFAVAAWLTRHRMKAHTHTFSKKHMCGICGRSFAVAFWLTRHMKIHEQGNTVVSSQTKVKSTPVKTTKANLALPWVCGECGLRFRFISWLKRHQKNNRHGNGYFDDPKETDSDYQFICDHQGCDRRFKTKHHLARHKQSHLSKESATKTDDKESEPSIFVCEVKNCGKSFQTRRMYTRHVMKHSQNTDASSSFNSKCSVCGKVFATQDLLERHFKRIHGSKGSTKQNDSTGRGPPYVCKHCNKEFECPLQYGRHVATHKKQEKKLCKAPQAIDENKIYRCDECKLSFKSLHIWNKHMDGQHKTAQIAKKTIPKPDPDHPYKCDICGRTFAVSFWLTRHKNEHRKEEYPYKCDVCGKTFAAQAWLTRHKNEHLKEESPKDDYPFKCDECQKSFASMAWLTRHKNEHGKAETSYNCEECGKTFAAQSWLTRHKHEHEASFSAVPEPPHVKPESQVFKCDDCGKGFGAQAWLTRHKREHDHVSSSSTSVPDFADFKPQPIMKGNSKVYQCDLCPMEFPWPSWLMKHRKLHKRNFTKVKVKKAKTKTAAKKSAKITNDTAANSYEGKNANELFEMLEKSGVKQYQCKVCKKSTVWHTGIMYHIRVHHTHEKPFKCKVCSKAFHMSGDLTKHSRRHSGEKPFYCQHCKKRFATSQQVKKHQVVHQPKSRSSLFHCKFCGKGYRDRSSVWRHLARKSCKSQNSEGDHVEPKEEASNATGLKIPKKTLKAQNEDSSKQTSQVENLVKEEKPSTEKTDNTNKHVKVKVPEKKTKKVVKKKSFQCKNCNKTFPTSDLFKDHIESYKKAQHIVCEYCGKCWVRTADLKRHLRVHTNERPYMCPDCGLAFKVSDALKRHMNKLHPKSTKKIIKVKCRSLEESSRPTADTKAGTSSTITEVTMNDSDAQVHIDDPSTSGIQDDSILAVEESSMAIQEPTILETESSAPDAQSEEVSSAAVKVTSQEVQKKDNSNVVTEVNPEHQNGVGKDIKKKKVNIKSNKKCNFCGKMFSGPGNLARHIRLHTGEKPFKCDHCEECFMRTDILTQHVNKYHPRL